MKVKFSIFSLITLFFIEFVSGQNAYCNLESCGNKKDQHTLCLYKPNTVSTRCRGNLGGGLTQKEINDIVNLHNVLRQRVAYGQETRGRPGPQPAASNMQNLQWDNELANIAQTWANQCIWDHDACRDVRRYAVGQNIAYKGTTGNVNSINILDMVNGWYNEVKDFNRHDVRSYKSGTTTDGKQIGHYTQFVWANTNKIGCGLRNYIDGGFNKKYLVCNYGPSGNWKEQPLYEQL